MLYVTPNIPQPVEGSLAHGTGASGWGRNSYKVPG